MLLQFLLWFIAFNLANAGQNAADKKRETCEEMGYSANECLKYEVNQNNILGSKLHPTVLKFDSGINNTLLKVSFLLPGVDDRKIIIWPNLRNNSIGNEILGTAQKIKKMGLTQFWQR